MTRIVVEDTWYVEPAELTEMVLDAMSRIDESICYGKPSSFQLDRFSTNKDGRCITASGEGYVEASVLGRRPEQCRVEFETRTELDDSDGIPDSAWVTVRVIEDTI